MAARRDLEETAFNTSYRIVPLIAYERGAIRLFQRINREHIPVVSRQPGHGLWGFARDSIFLGEAEPDRHDGRTTLFYFSCSAQIEPPCDRALPCDRELYCRIGDAGRRQSVQSCNVRDGQCLLHDTNTCASLAVLQVTHLPLSGRCPVPMHPLLDAARAYN